MNDVSVYAYPAETQHEMILDKDGSETALCELQDVTAFLIQKQNSCGRTDIGKVVETTHKIFHKQNKYQ